MRVSKYTFFVTNKGKCYLYNSLSNALVFIEKDVFLGLKNSIKNDVQIEDIITDDELLEMLSTNGFICESDKDALLLYKSAIQRVREQKGFMHLTIAPTMDCCFKCFYCFEHNKKREYMSENTMDAIINYIKAQKGLKRILLTWFGGEPLMAQNQMLTLYRKLRSSFKGSIDSNIITTGFHIDHTTVALFKELGISSLQITLDGDKEQHNRIKHIDGCSDVFTRVINNIKSITNELPELNISFRVNITKQNAANYPSLYRKLSFLFAAKRVSISPAIVKDKMRHDGQSEINNQVFFSSDEFSRYVLSLFEKHNIHTPYLLYPGNDLCECAIRDKMAISFDPSGYAYKCWEKIGDKHYAIGKLQSDGKLSEMNIKELNRELYGADPLMSPRCVKCKYLPICNGGCPIERIQNEYEGYNNNTCTLYRGQMERFLRNHIKMKEKGFPNRHHKE